ncbi:putative DNA polymerase [Lactococcus phage 5171F]|nr:putative DNA polymerase [Lactococcus phage 5171F]QGT52361.1 putative DNA polymerase [Lactococcus phage 5171F]
MGKNSKYSILTVEARNYAYDKEVCLGYVADQFQIIDPTGNKPKEILEEEQKEGEEYEETKNDAESLLTALQQKGKVKEIND